MIVRGHRQCSSLRLFGPAPVRVDVAVCGRSLQSFRDGGSETAERVLPSPPCVAQTERFLTSLGLTWLVGSCSRDRPFVFSGADGARSRLLQAALGTHGVAVQGRMANPNVQGSNR